MNLAVAAILIPVSVCILGGLIHVVYRTGRVVERLDNLDEQVDRLTESVDRRMDRLEQCVRRVQQPHDPFYKYTT